jgi:diguanylate cyclase (GGDEF)-like protein/PAS domain S-box-containing protein
MDIYRYFSIVAGAVVVLVFVAFAFWQWRARKRLARAPQEGGVRPRPRFRPNNWAPAIFVLLVALVIAGGGYQIIRAHERQTQAATQRELAAIADLRVSQIEDWLAECFADARAISTNPYVTAAMGAIVAAPEVSPELQATFLHWLRMLRESYRYEDIFLVDADGKVRASVNPNAARPGREKLEEAVRAMRGRTVAATGFRFDAGGREAKTHFGIIAPLLAGATPDEPVRAALIFRIDPRQFLIPTIERWPIASATGETLLAMVDRGEITYLGPLRHLPGGNKPRFPVTKEKLAAAIVARGEQGTLEAVDYRDVPVYAAGRAVRGTPWLVVAKIDVAEAYGPVRRELAFLAGVTLSLILVAALATGLWWRGQLIRFSSAQREARLREQTLVRHFEYLSRFANDIVLLTDDTGRIVEANDRAVAAYGLPRDELIGMPMIRLRDEKSATRMVGQGAASDGIVYEVQHRRRDGSLFPVEVSVRSLDAGGRQFSQAIIRDISERRRAEAKLQLDAMVFERARDGILVADRDANIISVNRAFTDMTGYAESEVIGRNPRLLASGRHGEDFYREMWRSIRENGFWQGEIWNRRKNGEIFPEWETIAASTDEEGRLTNYIAIFSDISERIKAEERLRFQAHILDMIGEAVIAIDPKGQVAYWNRGAERLYGLSPEDTVGRSIFEIAGGHLVNPEDIEMIRGGAQTQSREIELKNDERGTFVVLITISPILDQAGAHAGYIGISRDITERKQAEERLAQLAQYDTLTGLPNRNLFRDRLEQAMARAKRTGEPMALLFLDLDRFKEINDTLGHAAGDELLRGVGDRLRDKLREVDTIARLGGDEFTVILESISGTEEAERIARKIVDLFSRPIPAAGQEMYVTASVGATVYPGDADNAEELLKTADIAMYEAKQEGRNGYQFFSRESRARSADRMSIETKLRRALKRGELSLAYQPRVRIRTKNVVGFEALLRWRNAELGDVDPHQFISVAEETGLIVPIGDWAIREACRQWKEWSTNGRRPVISVNLSARQFRQKDMVKRTLAIVREAGMDPDCLELEMTETMVMGRPEDAIVKLDALRAGGVRLSVDDFGTGYSSLAYLKRFPFNALKIDQSFVRDVTVDSDDAAIVGAILSVARHLNMTVVAEGVETAEQLDFLEKLGCDEYQGFYFSGPAPASDVRW